MASTDLSREQLISECMQLQGFDYVPNPMLGQGSSPVGNLPAGLPPDEFKARYGYGIASGYESTFDADGKTKPPVPDPPNPNIDYYESLSESAQRAYDDVLSGQDGESGCVGEAIEQTNQLGVLLDRFGDDLTAIEQGVKSDPRVIDADTNCGKW